MFHLRTLLAASLTGLALGKPKQVQSPLNDWADASKSCSPQNMTMYMPGNDSFTLGAPFVHYSGKVGAIDAADVPATQWTLVAQPEHKDGWRIYTTQPNGQQLWWNNPGTELQLSTSIYGATTFFMKIANETGSPRPRTAIWANDRCMRFTPSVHKGHTDIYMDDKGYCAPIVLEPTTPLQWESSHTVCENEPESVLTELKATPETRTTSEAPHTEPTSGSDPSTKEYYCRNNRVFNYCQDYSDCPGCAFYTRCCSRVWKSEDCGQCKCGQSDNGYCN